VAGEGAMSNLLLVAAYNAALYWVIDIIGTGTAGEAAWLPCLLGALAISVVFLVGLAIKLREALLSQVHLMMATFLVSVVGHATLFLMIA
jgi:hypothetical protein